jgi:hypothetical protein
VHKSEVKMKIGLMRFESLISAFVTFEDETQNVQKIHKYSRGC